METLISDIRHALRVLRHSPGFAATAIAVLALEIGASTAIFSVVNAVLLEPLPFPDPDRIVTLMNSGPQGSFSAASVPKYNVWRRQTQVLSDIAAFDTGGPGINLSGDRPEQVKGIHASHEFFHLFGIGTVRARDRFNTLLLGTFAFFAILLASIGLYGLMSYSVEQRWLEFGIRLALGANFGQLRGMVVKQAMLLAMVGILIGLGAALGLTRYLATLLFQVKPNEPAIFMSVPLLLLVVALLSCYLPARRATRVSPMDALRYQ
jgi:hypothetical protein